MLNERLKQAREEKGISQVEAARAIGVSQAAYCYYEQGLRDPSLENIKRLSRLYNVSLDWLVGTEEENAEG